jgi:NAD(P)-dependent dehydrogenase (short-subunit alcohol dehydrogenase family)
MDLDLSGRVALVTGGSKGIGREIAAALAEHGAKVMICARKQPDLDAAAATMSGEVATLAANAGDPEQAVTGVAACVDRFGRLDILVNNAATNPYYGPLIDVDVPRHDKTWDVNFRGPLLWTQQAWRAWMSEHGGCVLNTASISGLSVDHDGSIGLYGATKAALIHLTRQLAYELAPGVRVNAIAPGLIKTEMARALWEPNEEEWRAAIPLQRLGTPADIADLALFLVSDAGAWITGQVHVVDGGATITGNAPFRATAADAGD